MAKIHPSRATGTHQRPVAIRWYRPQLDKQTLAQLNTKNNFKATVQTVGYLLTLIATGTLFVILALGHSWLAIPALFIHGACCAFLINGFHELVHDSVFKSKNLNRFFLQIFSFLGWYNHIGFWVSHSEHHRFTLHPPDDLEVVLPQQVTFVQVLKFGIVDLNGLLRLIPGTLKSATGHLNGEWETYLFTRRKPEMRPALHRWATIVLAGHLTLAVVTIPFGLWPIPLAVSLGRFFGSGLQFLCNATQHIGLTDEVEDFRLCCRTFYLNPVLRFLYWNMNYHTEHHMFAGVPCYNLPLLHQVIKEEMPVCTRGLVATWRQIGWILMEQQKDPAFRFSNLESQFQNVRRGAPF